MTYNFNFLEKFLYEFFLLLSGFGQFFSFVKLASSKNNNFFLLGLVIDLLAGFSTFLF